MGALARRKPSTAIRTASGRRWIIDPRWFRHLAPKSLLSHHATFDLLYREFLGGELAWQRETGRRFKVGPRQIVDAILLGQKLQVPVGDPIPTIEMIVEIGADGTSVRKVLPRWLMRTVTEEHARRTPGEVSGTMSSHPTLILEANPVDPATGRAIGVREVFVIPAHLLIKPRYGLPIIGPKPYTVYCHSFGDPDREEDRNHLYYGITQRSWQERWTEHRRAIESGSPLRFHRTFRERVGGGLAKCVVHEVIHVTDDLDDLYEWEESLVADAWGDPLLLNMVPGGKAGLAYMAKNGLLGKRDRVRPDERDAMLERWLSSSGRTGIPAPWMAERWTDPGWASSFVCAGVGRLTQAQVRRVRELGSDGLSDERIRELSGARTVEQVRGVLSGKRYSRVV